MQNRVRAMNKRLRRIIFWFFVLIFAFLGPLLILYTAGYRYNLQNGQIVRTGVLSVATDPRGVGLYLNDELQKEKTPTVIKRLMPGSYSIRLEKTGYHSWSGQLKILSGATTNLNTVLLFLDSEPIELFTKEANKLVADPNGRLITYTIVEGNWEEIWLYDLQTESHQIINQRTEPNQETEISWSKNGSFLSAFNPELGISIFERNGTQVDLGFIQTKEPESISWHPSNGDVVFLASANGLEEVDLRAESSKIIENTDENSISLDASILNFVDDGFYIELIQLINGEPELLALLPRSKYTIAERDGSYLILTDQNHKLILLDIHAEIPILLQTQTDIYDWIESKDLLVFSNGYEVKVYDPGPHETEFITRQGDEIQSLMWHSSAASILLVHEYSIHAHEHYNAANSRNNFTLVDDFDEIISAWVAVDGQTLYFYAFQDGAYGLYKLELTKSFISL